MSHDGVCVDRFCAEYDGFKCVGCLAGYNLDAVSRCRKVPVNCVRIDGDGLCSQCIHDYYLGEDK